MLLDRDGIVKRLYLAEKRASTEIEALKMAGLSQASYENHIHRYVLAKMLLDDEEAAVASDDLNELARMSVAKAGKLNPNEAELLDVSRHCGGTSSAMTKKVLLFMSLEECLSFSFSDVDTAAIKTTGQLAATVKNLVQETGLAMNINEIRKDFPILQQQVNGRPLLYFDNAATAQIPRQVLDEICGHIQTTNANVHRGIHQLSENNSRCFEEAREYIAVSIGATSRQEIIFTSGTTDSINMVADSLLGDLQKDDEIVTTVIEHHSNFIPWQQCALRTKARLNVIHRGDDGTLDMAMLRDALSERTKIVAVSHCSNVLGISHDIKEICRMAHACGARVLVDGAQGIPHMPVDVSEMECDWYCFSGHKLMCPTGIGVLYAKKEVMDEMVPNRFGGGMVRQCTLQGCRWEDGPNRFEAGTPNYIGAIGLAAAMKYRESLGVADLFCHEEKILARIEVGLRGMPGLRVLGQTARRTGCLSFTVEGVHPFDVAMFLDQNGVAVRSGTLCASPLLASYGERHVVRVSPSFYNTIDEVDSFLDVLASVVELLQGKNAA